MRGVFWGFYVLLENFWLGEVSPGSIVSLQPRGKKNSKIGQISGRQGSFAQSSCNGGAKFKFSTCETQKWKWKYGEIAIFFSIQVTFTFLGASILGFCWRSLLKARAWDPCHSRKHSHLPFAPFKLIETAWNPLHLPGHEMDKNGRKLSQKYFKTRNILPCDIILWSVNFHYIAMCAG